MSKQEKLVRGCCHHKNLQHVVVPLVPDVGQRLEEQRGNRSWRLGKKATLALLKQSAKLSSAVICKVKNISNKSVGLAKEISRQVDGSTDGFFSFV